MIPYFLKWVFANRFCFGWVSGAFFVVALAALAALDINVWLRIPIKSFISAVWYLVSRHIAFKYFDC